MSYSTSPLEIPEIVRLIGRLVEKSSLLAVMKVSGTFHDQVAPTAWQTIVVDFRNKALYSNMPSYTDRFKEDPRLLPWESLKTYGCYVRNVEMTSYLNSVPPSRYPKPASTADLLTALADITLLKSMTLEICDVDIADLPQLFSLCSRLKSLNITNCSVSNGPIPNLESGDMRDWEWKSQALAHPSSYELEELSVSSGCGVGLWEFLSRSPQLRVLSLYDCCHHDLYEMARLNDLARYFDENCNMPNLENVDVCISRVNGSIISQVLKSVRCLRSFQCHRNNALLPIQDFRSHFSTLTSIDVRSGTPEFWQEVMSSCPVLVKAKEVVLLAEDITGQEKWVTTALESLDVYVFLKSYRNERSRRRAQEKALFQKIAKLVKLKHLSVHTGWRFGKSLHDEELEVLLGMKTLTSIELGPELTANWDVFQVMDRFSDKKKNFRWTEADMSVLSPTQRLA